jgi:hypothetical protein
MLEIVLLSLLVQSPEVEITSPLNPRFGFAMDENGFAYMGKIVDNKVICTKLRLKGTQLEEVGNFAGPFKGELDIFITPKGIAITDYAAGIITMFNKSGNKVWSVHCRNPLISKATAEGDIWVVVNTGNVYKKTPASSSLEPVLGFRGEEISLVDAADIAPLSKHSFYGMDAFDQIFFFDAQGRRKRIAQLGGHRLVPSVLGGVLLFREIAEGPVVTHIANSGVVKDVWKGSKSLGTARHFSRIQDGRLAIGFPRAKGGTILILPPEKGGAFER